MSIIKDRPKAIVYCRANCKSQWEPYGDQDEPWEHICHGWKSFDRVYVRIEEDRQFSFFAIVNRGVPVYF